MFTYKRVALVSAPIVALGLGAYLLVLFAPIALLAPTLCGLGGVQTTVVSVDANCVAQNKDDLEVKMGLVQPFARMRWKLDAATKRIWNFDPTLGVALKSPAEVNSLPGPIDLTDLAFDPNGSVFTAKHREQADVYHWCNRNVSRGKYFYKIALVDANGRTCNIDPYIVNHTDN